MIAIKTHRTTVLLVLALTLGACRDSDDARWENDEGEVAATWEPEPVEEVMGVPIDTLRMRIMQRVDSGPRPEGLRASSWKRVRELYAGYAYVPLWFEGNDLHPRTGDLMNAIAHAHTDGIRAAAYPIADMHRSLTTLREGDSTSASMLLDTDILLTAAFVELAEDMFTGQVDPKSIAQGWYIDAPEAEVDSALAYTLRLEPLDRGIARMRPQLADFDALREQLTKYREIVAAGGWQRVPDGAVLEPGDTTTVERMEALAARLAAESYLDDGVRIEPLRDSTGATTDRALYDSRLAGAVATFQSRHAIVVDSILGGGTLASLNNSAEYRLRQIAANLERLRWLPRTLGDRYIFVNVPAFRLEAYDRGQRALEMKVIVGSEFNDQATPVFADSMSYVVFRPYWNVPKNIALEEILPDAAKDPNYLRKRDYEVVRGWSETSPVVGQSTPSWSAIESGQVRIRQRPGRQNALGSVKFMFPNDFDIYLHDTAAPELFEQDIRAFSHGCIRVERPDELGQFVLGWEPERVREAMQSGPEARHVSVERKIPVYIMYLTTYVRDGVLYFGNDLYDRDEKLTMAVADAAVPTADTTRMIEELRELVAD